MTTPPRDVRDRALLTASAIAFAAIAIAGATYAFANVLPAATVSQAAAHAAMASRISAWLQTPADAVDALGWAGWANHAAFVFASSGFYVLSVPLVRLLGGNAAVAVKLLQTIAVLAGWLSTAYLYRVVTRTRTPWALAAGGLYALLPWDITIVRGDPVAGLLVATVPLAGAIVVALTRRWGPAALPLCGAIAALATMCLAGRAGIAAAAVLLLVAAVTSFEKKESLRWVCFATVALACTASATAYFLFPTLAYQIATGVPMREMLPLGGAFFSGCWYAIAMPAGAAGAIALTAFLERRAFSNDARSRSSPIFAIALLVAGLVAFFWAGGTAGKQTAPVELLRQTLTIDTIAKLRGGRITNTTDWPLYGASLPFSQSAGDLVRRFGADGLGAAGALARVNVTTLVATDGSQTAAVPIDGARGYLRSAIPACISGATSLFDRISAMKPFAGFTFEDANPCSRTLYADDAPTEQLLGGSLVETFTGDELFPHAHTVRKADASGARFHDAAPSYYTSVDGFVTRIGNAPVALAVGSTASNTFTTSNGPWVLAVRAACHSTVHGRLFVDGVHQFLFVCKPANGFQWLRFPFRASAGLHSFSIEVDSAAPQDSALGDWAFALDGILLLNGGVIPTLPNDVGFAFTWPPASTERWLAAGTYAPYGVLRDGRNGRPQLTLDGKPTGDWLHVSASGRHDLRWPNAPPSAALVALVPKSWQLHVPHIRVKQTAGIRWSIEVRDQTTLELAALPDENWELTDIGTTVTGTRCDLLNVCFNDVPPGKYELRHAWPSYSAFSFAWTALAWLLAALILLNEVARQAGYRAEVSDDDARPMTYFWYTGWLVAIVCTITYLNWVRLGAYGWMFATQLAGICAATAAIGYGTIVFGRNAARLQEPGQAGPWYRWAAFAGVAFATLAALTLDTVDHRKFVLVIAISQTLAVAALHRQLPKRAFGWLALSAFVSWSLVSGITFTRLGDFFLGASSSTGLATTAFVCGFALVIYALREAPAIPETNRWKAIWFGVAIALFAFSALRTDNLGTEWVPIHRSYFSDVAQLVRDGHWLLWDVPSLYGFLSILTLAAIPAKNGLQAVFELTAIFLTIQACFVFAILRWGRTGRANALLALLFPIATFFNDGISRYPWSARLYPQGGLRFFWTDALVFVIFLTYAWREFPRRIYALKWAGHVLWAIAMFWSVETAVWATSVWIPFLALHALTASSVPFSLRAALRAFLRDLWPLAALPAAGIAIVELFYRTRLGHPPDWIAFIEFLGLFTSGIRPIFRVGYLGSAWTILLVLAALGTLGIVALRERRYALVPLLASTWLAVCSTASYWALEPIDMYVSLLLTVLVPASAIAIFASREDLRDRLTATIARYSLAPLAIVAIATAFGEASHLQAVRFPLTAGWHFDITRDAPPISGELAALLERAGVTPSDSLLVPSGTFWTEPKQGLIQPFVRLQNGDVVEYRSWLPESPAGASDLFQGLTPSRQQTYISRFLDLSHSAGWYVTYRHRADCTELSPRLLTVRSLSSTNFNASLCSLK